MVNVEVVYAAADQKITQIKLCLPDNSTVADALDHSNIYIKQPETKDLALGVFGKQVSLEYVLRSGDRIEIYRPLALEPMERRRKRAGKFA
ncbi:RnfH family protein [Legionella israelensis]|uniref:RnfH family protein n=1 Tax=Legionella israelensis TaxID=454 RepID=UPI00117D43F5|nr:RnfH family protein [Legionella israelensis]QDP71719.1 RnfH family protein [Legionella israelensis]